MSYKQMKVTAKKFGGWVEGSGSEIVVRFPSPHQKELFLKECEGLK